MILQHTLGLFFIIALRYFAVAGSAYFFWWVWKAEAFMARKIQLGFPNPRIRRAEIKYSLLSSAVFALIGAWVFVAWEQGHTKLYSHVNQFGWGYLIFTLPVLMFLHDAYFYFTHRIMHWAWFFKRVHRVHHLSRNPTPWTAFSFHPWEALIEAAIFPALVFFIPIHLGVFFFFLLMMTVLSVINHLGYELYPRRFAAHKIGRWIISATHHDQHHRNLKCNFGLYFTIWDRWLLSENASYSAVFENNHPPRQVDSISVVK